MKNKVQTDVFTEKQLNLAVKRREEGDYIGALNVLRALISKNPDAEVYRETAKVYMDLDLIRTASGYWFKFLDTAREEDKAEAYNALGACFFLMDNYRLAGYYYDLQLTVAPDGEFDYLDEKLDYFDMISSPEEPDFYVSYPPKKMPSDKRIELAEKNLYLTGDKESLKLLKTVPETDQNYVGAQLRIAAYYAVNGDVKKAKTVINGLIEAFPDDTLPVINMFVLLADTGNYKDAEKAYQALEKCNLVTFEECYKVATSCMNIGRDDLAIKYALKALDDYPYSVNGLFLAGAAEYNLGNKSQAEKYFITVYQLTDYPVAKYYIDRCRDEEPKLKRIGYEMHYPEKIMKKLVEKAIGYIHDRPKITERNLSGVLKVCDFIYSFHNNLQEELALSLMEAKNERLENYFINLLMVNEIEEKVKFAVVYSLLMNDREKTLSAVYSGLYFKFKISPLWTIDLGGKASVIKRAHAYAAARMSAFYKTDFKKLSQSAKSVFEALNENGNLDKVEDVSALGAAMLVISDSVYAKDTNFLASYFGTKKTKINQTLKLIRCKNEDC